MLPTRAAAGELARAIAAPRRRRILIEEIARLECTSPAEIQRDLWQARSWVRAKLAEEYGKAPQRRFWEKLVRVAEEVPATLDYSSLRDSLKRARMATQGLPSTQAQRAARGAREP